MRFADDTEEAGLSRMDSNGSSLIRECVRRLCMTRDLLHVYLTDFIFIISIICWNITEIALILV